MVPRGIEPRTLRLLAVRSNQMSYETLRRCSHRAPHSSSAATATTAHNSGGHPHTLALPSPAQRRMIPTCVGRASGLVAVAGLVVKALGHTSMGQLTHALYHTMDVAIAPSGVQMVPRGLEPQTLRLLAARSNQLSYETSCVMLLSKPSCLITEVQSH